MIETKSRNRSRLRRLSSLTPAQSFSKATDAVVRSYEEGYISRDEADILLKWAAAHYIAPTIERAVSEIADTIVFDLAEEIIDVGADDD